MPSLWVVSFADNTPFPDAWIEGHPAVRSIRIMNQTAVILYGTPTRPAFNARWVLEDEAFLAVHSVAFRNFATYSEYPGEHGTGAAIQMGPGPNRSGPKWVWAQRGSNGPGPKWARA